MPPKRFEGKFGIPPSHPVDSLLTQALYRLPESVGLEHIERLTNDIVTKVNVAREHEGVVQPLTPEETQTLKLKLARHYEDNGESAVIDIPTCVDALVESPRFLRSDKGSMEKLFDLHEMKTLQKVAELRRKRAEITELGGEKDLNPYENLFTTASGNYYVARLLNMPHLEEESAYMEHCVGTSDSYINKMKRGEVEILSFRLVPKIHQETQSLEDDVPIITIEYNLKTKTIEQMKRSNDAYLNKKVSYFADVVDALKQLRTTKTDTGELRDFKKIAPSELEDIDVRDEYILTDRGEVHFHDFNPENGDFVLKMGKLEITKKTSKEDAVRLLRIVDGVDYASDQVACTLTEISERTKVYIGPLEPGIFDTLPRSVEYISTSFLEGKIQKYSVELGGTSKEQLRVILKERNISVTSYADDLLKNKDFEISSTSESADLVRLTARDLGFPQGATTDDIYAKAAELGLELCPAEVGPQLRLSYTAKEWMIIAMKQIADRNGDSNVFSLDGGDGALGLDALYAEPGYRWDSDRRFVFRLRK